MNILSFEALLRTQVFDAIHWTWYKYRNLYMCCVAMDMIFFSAVERMWTQDCFIVPKKWMCTVDDISSRKLINNFRINCINTANSTPKKWAQKTCFPRKKIQILYEAINYAWFAPNLFKNHQNVCTHSIWMFWIHTHTFWKMFIGWWIFFCSPFFHTVCQR